VAGYSNKYNDQLKDDPLWRVRAAVARYSNKYHEQLKKDKHWCVREAVNIYIRENK